MTDKIKETKIFGDTCVWLWESGDVIIEDIVDCREIEIKSANVQDIIDFIISHKKE